MAKETKEEAIERLEAVWKVTNAKEQYEKIEHFGFTPFENSLILTAYFVGYAQGADLLLPGFKKQRSEAER